MASHKHEPGPEGLTDTLSAALSQVAAITRQITAICEQNSVALDDEHKDSGELIIFERIRSRRG
jgi:hypothetical protein